MPLKPKRNQTGLARQFHAFQLAMLGARQYRTGARLSPTKARPSIAGTRASSKPKVTGIRTKPVAGRGLREIARPRVKTFKRTGKVR